MVGSIILSSSDDSDCEVVNPPPRQAVSPARPPPPPPAARPLPAPAPAQTVEELVLSDSDDDAKPSTSAHPASQTEAKPDVDAAPGSAAGRPSPVVAARPAPTMAARKGPLGGISARPVGGKRNKTRLVHPTKRAPTTIDVVTTAKDAAERTQKREARAKQDPPVSNVPRPFSVTIVIDHLSYSTALFLTPPILSLRFSFRDAHTAPSAATPVASFSRLLPTHPADESGFVNFSSSSLPPIPPLSITHSTKLSETREHASVDLVLVIALSSTNSKAPSYQGSISFVEYGRVLRLGSKKTTFKPSTKPSTGFGSTANGGAVSINWEMTLARMRKEMWAPWEDAKDCTDDELKEALNDALLDWETKWRLEVAEREDFVNALEAAHSHATPVKLDSLPQHPSPASLIPGLNDEEPVAANNASSVRIGPVPYYQHVDLIPRALPLDPGPLKAFPFYPRCWDVAAQVNAQVARDVGAFLRCDTDGDLPVDPDNEAKRVKEMEEKRLERYIEEEAFDAPDPARVRRDFDCLEELLAYLRLTPLQLIALEREARREAGDGHDEDIEYHACEQYGDADHPAVKAMAVFEPRVGVSASQAQRRRLRVDGRHLIPIICKSSRPEPCSWCGALFCIVHGDPHDQLKSYNVPTRPSKLLKASPTSADECPHCCRSDCLLRHGRDNTVKLPPMTAAQEKMLEKLVESEASLTPCDASFLLGYPVFEHEKFSYEVPVAPRDKKKATNELLPPAKSDGYEPCSCKGDCSGKEEEGEEKCSCAVGRTFCDRFCGCPPSCSRRWLGCDCGVCNPRCPCVQQGRECDPLTCGCEAQRCDNCAIRLSNYKQTAVVKSGVSGGGFGLIVMEDVKKGELIGLYGGELLALDENGGPGAEWQFALLGHEIVSFWFDLEFHEEAESSHAIDSQIYGSAMRYINHGEASKANCKQKIRYVLGTPTIGIYAKTDLPAGAELFMHYGAHYPEPTTQDGWKEDFVA